MDTKNNAPILLEYKDVTVSYGPVAALKGINIKIYQGEIVTLIGANGAGKTTLMMTLFGQPSPSSGQILYQGNPIHFKGTHEIAQLGISIAPEGRRIFPKMTVQENLELGWVATKNKIRFQQDIERIYHLFPLLKKRRRQRAGTLSGGEQQMLAMGRSLMSQPNLFLLDEPSLGLAPQIVNQLFEILQEIAQQGTTLFFVEQNAHHALRLADRGYVLVNGTIKFAGQSQSLLSDSKIQEAYLGKTPLNNTHN